MLPPNSRAILIGVSRYDDPVSFPELQAAANSLRAMRTLLADPGLCGWPPEQITTIPNPRDRAELENLLSDAAEATTGVLLIYYVGHGILSPRLELCLTVATSKPTRPKITAVPWESVAEILDFRNCPARARIVILDCCYAGQVISESLSSTAAMADAVAVEGVYTLTATTKNKTAHVVPFDEQDLACTSFTGELCDLVREGIAGRGEWLTLGELYPILRSRLQSKGLPLPNQKGVDTAERFPFTANSALGELTAPKRILSNAVVSPIPSDARQEKDSAFLRWTALNCFDTVVSYVYGTRDYSTDVTQMRLSDLAEYAAVADPDRSERIARRLPDQDRRRQALIEIALVMAIRATAVKSSNSSRAADLMDRASRIALELAGVVESSPMGKLVSQATTQPRWMGRLMQGLAESDRWVGKTRLVLALAAQDPEEADKYFEEALRASRFSDKWGRSVTRSDVAQAMVVKDPERAFEIAKSVDDKSQRSEALRKIAQAVVGEDRDQAARMLAEAERVTDKIRDKVVRAAYLCGIAEALAPLDAPWAERVANSIDHPGLGPAGRYRVAALMARADPVRAERIGRALPYDADKAAILALVARFFADPDRTAALLAEADKYLQPLESDARKAAGMAEIARTLSAFDPANSAVLFDEIENLIASLADTNYMHLLLRIVQRAEEIDPDRAARLLKAICTMTLSPGSIAVNDMSRGMSLLNIAEQCMKIISSQDALFSHLLLPRKVGAASSWQAQAKAVPSSLQCRTRCNSGAAPPGPATRSSTRGSIHAGQSTFTRPRAATLAPPTSQPHHRAGTHLPPDTQAAISRSLMYLDGYVTDLVHSGRGSCSAGAGGREPADDAGGLERRPGDRR
ncbi:MAG: hypothetical protein ABSA02_04560 [Trebonia sp.]|jgi:hypothetical protein